MEDVLEQAQATKVLLWFAGTTYDQKSHPTLLYLQELKSSGKKDDLLTYHRFLKSLEAYLKIGVDAKHSKHMGEGIFEIRSSCGRDKLLRVNCTKLKSGEIVILNHYLKDRIYEEKKQTKRHGRHNEERIASSLVEAIEFRKRLPVKK